MLISRLKSNKCTSVQKLIYLLKSCIFFDAISSLWVSKIHSFHVYYSNDALNYIKEEQPLIFWFREKLRRKCANRRSESVSVQGNPRHFCKPGVQQAAQSMNQHALSFQRSRSHISIGGVRNNLGVLIAPFAEAPKLQPYDATQSLIYYHEPTISFPFFFWLDILVHHRFLTWDKTYSSPLLCLKTNFIPGTKSEFTTSLNTTVTSVSSITLQTPPKGELSARKTSEF